MRRMNTFDAQEERLALFLDYENLAIGARDAGFRFDVAPLADVLAERGRLVVRRAYGDWNLFSGDRRSLVDSHVELIDIVQRSDAHRKNAADIKLAVDAMELALAREYVSTFVIASGDSDFTPLVAKLRELNRRVIGVGVQGSTSALLPNSCDEFIFYDRIEAAPRRDTASKTRPSKKAASSSSATSSSGGARKAPRRKAEDLTELYRLVTQPLSGMQRSATGPVYASGLKRALLRKDPTFSEADHGFRAFSEMLRRIEAEGHIALRDGAAQGDPEVDFPTKGGEEEQAFELLVSVVSDLQKKDADVPLSGLKDLLRKRDASFSEKDYGYSNFLQFCKAAATRNLLDLEWDDVEQEYFLRSRDRAAATAAS